MARYRRGTRLPQSTTRSITIDAAVKEYLDNQRLAGSSRSYLEELSSYLVGQGKRTTWTPLLPWGARQRFTDVTDLNRDNLIAYLHSVENRPGPTYYKACAILRRFLNFLKAQGHIAEPPLDVPRPKRHRSQIQVFTENEILRLRDIVARENVRDWAIFVLLCDTGIRAKELCGLRLSDLALGRGEITVRAAVAKNRTARVLPLSSSVPALRAYLKVRGTDESATDALFLGFYSTPVVRDPRSKARRTVASLDLSRLPLTRTGLYALVRKWGILAGITEARCSPHTFRHFFATQFLRNGGDISSLRYLLGHSRLDVTERYLSLTRVDFRTAHARFSPALTLAGRKGRNAPSSAVMP